MIMFFIQTILSILGIVGFFTYNWAFMMIGLIGLIVCNIIGFLNGELKSLIGIPEILYVVISLILTNFINRDFLEIFSVVFCIGEAIMGFGGIVLIILFSRYQNKSNS